MLSEVAWVDVTLQFPDFARQPAIQEDIYEAELNYLGKLQKYRKSQLEKMLQGTAQAAWPRSLASIRARSASLHQRVIHGVVFVFYIC